MLLHGSRKLPVISLLLMQHEGIVTSLNRLSESIFAQHSKEIQGVREHDESNILWRSPVLEILNVIKKFGLIQVLVLRKDCRHGKKYEDERARRISNLRAITMTTSNSH